jgi:hypothetical protein
VIRLEHRSLPSGLSAVARRGERGELTIVVSETLDPGQQRAAVRAALRAARRHEWRLGLLPLPALLFMSAARSAVGRLGHLLRAHTVATAVGATATAGALAAGVLIFAMPTPHGPSSAMHSAPPAYQLSPGGSHATGRAHARTRPGASVRAGSTGPGVVVAVSPGASPHPTASPQPAPSPSPSASASSPPSGPSPSPTHSTSPARPTPTPTPSPSPTGGSGGGGRTCLKILGIVICL